MAPPLTSLTTAISLATFFCPQGGHCGEVHFYFEMSNCWSEFTLCNCNSPCGTKFFREFIFADWRFLVFCVNYFLWLGQIGFSCWELIFAIFRKYPVLGIDNIFVFVNYVQWKYIFPNNTTVWVPYVKPVIHCIPFCFWVKEATCN